MTVVTTPATLSLKETAARLAMGVTTLRRHIRNGSIDFTETGTGKLRRRMKFTEEQIEAFLRKQARRETPISEKERRRWRSTNELEPRTGGIHSG